MQILDFSDRHDPGESDSRAAGLLNSLIVCPDQKALRALRETILNLYPVQCFSPFTSPRFLI